MSISVCHLFSILLLHFIADFVLQTTYLAEGKSYNNRSLLIHTGTYSLVFGFVITICFPWPVCVQSIPFAAVTFIAHTVQDYFTSRLRERLIYKDRKHATYICMGFDQLLHYIQLVLTWKCFIA